MFAERLPVLRASRVARMAESRVLVLVFLLLAL
jgi:hypothetical protein